VAITMRRFIRWALMAASVAALGCGVAVPLATASAAATPACKTGRSRLGNVMCHTSAGGPS
jgi:hypothetical protein